jgi:hypothetical protein
MRIKQRLYFVVFLLTLSLSLTAQSQTPAETELRLLRNSDVLQMVADGVKPGDIITKILTSRCNFDIFPPVLRDLKRRGVPDTVLMAMKMAPSGPPAVAVGQPQPSLTTPVRVPAGMAIEVESAQAVSSAKVTPGSPITFWVTRRVYIKNILAIERGSLASGHITKVRKAGAFGRAGMLAWQMDYVVAVDGTHIPLQVSGKQTGANRSLAAAGGAAATAALVFPYTSPVALIWGLKKGDEAILRGSRVFNATVPTETEVAGLQPRPGGVIYRDRDTVKASAAPPTNTNFDRGGFKPKGGFRPQ